VSECISAAPIGRILIKFGIGDSSKHVRENPGLVKIWRHLTSGC